MTSAVIHCAHGEYEISTDPARVDVEAVHHFLTHDGYWSQGRSLAVVETSIANSGLVCAAYSAEGSLVGFARMVTDLATFAWLCDVFVLPEHRCNGLGVAIVTTIVQHPDVAHLKRQLLATRDAHQLYGKLGFAELEAPAKWMERRAP